MRDDEKLFMAIALTFGFIAIACILLQRILGN